MRDDAFVDAASPTTVHLDRSETERAKNLLRCPLAQWLLLRRHFISSVTI
jgi:hypothetical protein